jgi:hypothetical protein
MLPISVVVPHIETRREWFHANCLPSIQKNRPAQIIVEASAGGACEKRNAGAKKATQPYLFFADDDSILRENCLEEMLIALRTDEGASFAYSDTTMVLYPGIEYPLPEGVRKAMPWDVPSLRNGNYIETMSLMKTAVFPKFDRKLKRFQDWDLWLRLAKKGHRGVYIPKVLFELHHFDKGISASVPFDEALAAIKKKHRLA